MSVTDSNIEARQSANPTDLAREQIEGELREGVDARLTEIENTEEHPNQRIEAGIQALDPMMPLSEQTEQKASLEAVMEPLMVSALGHGEKPEELLVNPLIILRHKKTAIETAACDKLKLLISAQLDATKSWWASTLERAEEQYKAALEAKEREEKGASEESRWMSPGVKATLAISAAAGAAYFLWKYFKEEDPEKKSTTHLVAGAAMATMGVGVLLGAETIGKWSADYLGLDLSQEAIRDLLDGKGLRSLSFKSREPGIKKAAKHLNIDERTVIDLRDTKWEDFSNFQKQTERTGKSYFQSGLELVGLGNAPGISMDDDGKRAREEMKLEQLITLNEDKIDGDIDEMTIGEILTVLEREGVFGEPEKDKTKDSDGGTEDAEDAEDAEALANAGPVKGVIDNMKAGKLSFDEGMTELVDVANKDGWSFAIFNGVSFLAKGAVIIPLSSLNIWNDTITDLVSAKNGEGSWLNVPFETEQMYWAGTYAAWRVSKEAFVQLKAGKIEGGKLAARAVLGAGRGIFDSYALLPRVLSEGPDALRQVNYLKLCAEEANPNLSPEARLHLLHKKTAFLAERYEYYFKMAEDAQRSTGFTEKWGARARIAWKGGGPDWWERMVIQYGKKFRETQVAYLHAAGIEDTLTISGETIVDESTERATLAKVARKFLSDHPTSSLPQIPKYYIRSSKFSTLDDAAKAGLRVWSDPAQIERATKLGLNNDRIMLRLREMELTPKQIDQLLDEIEANPNIKHSLEEIFLRLKHPKLVGAALSTAKAAGILGTIYAAYEFEQSQDKLNTLGENVTMTNAFLMGGGAVGALIPHPIWKPVGFVAGGVISSLGGQYAWNSYGKPLLQKHLPNRNKFFEKPSEALSTYVAATANPFANLGYLADKAGVTDNVSPSTDPLAYLRESTTVFAPALSILPGISLDQTVGKQTLHTLDDLQTNAKKAMVDTAEELLKVKVALKEGETEELKAKKEQLERDLIVLQSYSDGTWMEIAKMDLFNRMQVLVLPALEAFKAIALESFGPKGAEKMTSLVERLQKGEFFIAEDEMQLWKFMCDAEITTGEGEKVNFADFASMAVMTYQDAKYLEELEAGIKTPQAGEGNV